MSKGHTKETERTLPIGGLDWWVVNQVAVAGGVSVRWFVEKGS